MESDKVIDLVQHYTDQIEVLKHEVEDAVQTVARIVASYGGRTKISPEFLLKDYELVSYKDPSGDIILASREVFRGSKTERPSS